MSRGLVVIVAALATVSAFAQTQTPAWDFFVRGNVQLYENFDQAPKGSPENDVTAVQGEVGANLKLTSALTAFGSVNLLHFNDDTLENSPGGRIGLRGDSRPHAFEVYLEVLNNRPSFELDQFAGADTRRLTGNYAYRFAKVWQVSVDGDFEQQEYDNDLRDNDYRAVGAAVRWRPSRLFSPEIGARVGERDVNDALQSYDQREMYLQIRSQPTPKWYLSARYRDRTRDYQNVDREDQRRQINFGADYSMTQHLVLNFYGAKEDVDSNLAGRDFDSGFWLAGVTWKF
jgi:hypothetical protein